MIQPVYLICGVSGSGKSWVCRQLTDKFMYVPHDRCWTHEQSCGWVPGTEWKPEMKDAKEWRPGATNRQPPIVIKTAMIANRPVITEAPFGERLLREDLERAGIKVIPYFVIEKPEVVKARYEKRENKPIPKAAHSRAASIIDRALEWKAPWGTSEQILTKLKELPL